MLYSIQSFATNPILLKTKKIEKLAAKPFFEKKNINGLPKKNSFHYFPLYKTRWIKYLKKEKAPRPGLAVAEKGFQHNLRLC